MTLASASCGEAGSTTVDDDGPLSTSTVVGGGAVDPPLGWKGSFEATFGSFVLCSTEEGASIRLTEVTFPSGAPDGVTAWVRRVLPDDVAAVAPRNRHRRFTPVAFGLGAPPSFDQPYSSMRPAGDYTDDVSAVTVDESCTQVHRAASALASGDVPTHGYDELMISVPSTHRGADVRGFSISYEADGRSYDVRVPWTMVVCDAKGTRRHCS
ncbi:hypothetical protein [Nocardioides sp. GY 10127]|uniref:hypothetical protein n=1 Tax=Nocardioides sp. GY 10127 TaxID=2569762 RepID=UPI0010A75112|nr:hypothetical protein [Nocardioides sp. GY 10127]TIC80189.1 hypothetical protein E8D37_16520 [Nocardioides sp. GY 10127]